jgi:hypothetical protein
MRRSLIIGIGILFVGLLQTATAGAADFDIWLTSDERGQISTDKVFTLLNRDPVFCFVVLRNLPPGEYQITFFWEGGIKQKTQYTHSFEIQRKGVKSHRCFSWLKLRPDNSVLGISEGYKNIIGRWEVSVFLNEKHLATKEFGAR